MLFYSKEHLPGDGWLEDIGGFLNQLVLSNCGLDGVLIFRFTRCIKPERDKYRKGLPVRRQIEISWVLYLDLYLDVQSWEV